MTQELDEHGNPIAGASDDGAAEVEAKRLQELEKRAEEMGSGSIEDYMEWLESQVVGPGEEPKRPVAPAKPATPAPQAADADTDGSGMDADTLAMLNDVKVGTAHAILESQYTRFEIAEGKKDEADKSAFTREEMEKVIKSPSQGALIQSVAADFDGNVWQAADYVLGIKGGLAKAKADGAASADALAKAKASATPASGKNSVAGDGDDGDKDNAQSLADEIAPKEGGYVEQT